MSEITDLTAQPDDPEGYYAALRLAPGADAQQVEAAYAALIEEWRSEQDRPRYTIQDAYRVLGNPGQKAAYDARREREAKPGPPSRVRTRFLWGLLTVLFVQAGFVFPGFLLPEPGTFDAGDLLVRQNDKARLGRIVRHKTYHRFANGKYGDAYLVQVNDETERWYPAGDLERHYTRLLETQRTRVP